MLHILNNVVVSYLSRTHTWNIPAMKMINIATKNRKQNSAIKWQVDESHMPALADDLSTLLPSKQLQFSYVCGEQGMHSVKTGQHI